MRISLFILLLSFNVFAAYQPKTEISGTVQVNVVSGTLTATNPSVSATGSAKPSSATFIGVDYLGNLIGVSGTAGGALVVSSTGTLALPSGASTAARQDTGNSSLSSIDSKLTTANALLTDIDGYISTTPFPVSSVGTVSVSGSVLDSIRNNQTDGSQKVQILSASGTALAARQLGSQVISGDYGLITHSVMHGLSSAGGGTFVDVKVNPSGSLEASGTFTINGSLPAFAATPTVSAGTVPVTGTFWQATQPVSIASTLGVSAGQVTVLQGTSPWTVSGSISLNGTQPVSATIGNTLNVNTHAVTQSGNWSQSILNSLGIASGTITSITNTVGVSAGTVAVSQVTSPWIVSGTVLPNGVFTVSAGTVGITAASTLSVSSVGTVIVSSTGTVPTSLASVPTHGVTQAGTWNAPSGTTIVSSTGTVIVSGTVMPNGTFSVSTTGIVQTSGTILNVPTAAIGDSLTNSQNANTSKVAIKASAGRLYSVFGWSNNTGCGWIHIFNAASQPAANTAPLQAIPVCQNQSYYMDFAMPFGMYNATGIYVGFSTSGTAWVNTSGNSSTWINVLYK